MTFAGRGSNCNSRPLKRCGCWRAGVTVYQLMFVLRTISVGTRKQCIKWVSLAWMLRAML